MSGYCGECGGAIAECQALVVVAAPGVWELATEVRLRCEECGKPATPASARDAHTPTLRPTLPSRAA